MDTCNPVMVEITRGATVESRHRGAAVVVRSDDSIVASWGDIDRLMYPRSVIKPLQALPLLETGAADRFAVSDQEIALACASHSGEQVHVAVVEAWLERLGLGSGNLVCGAHPPLSVAAAEDLVRKGETPTPLHNNCSGKHAGFLTTALYLRESITGYAGAAHPVQLRVRQMLSQLAGVEFNDASIGVDGCGVPTLAMPLWGLARCLARFADPPKLGRLRADAVSRILKAMTKHPELVAGQARFETSVMMAAGGDVVVKCGAEGTYGAILPKRGLGIAVKIDDGGKRAAESAMAALLLAFADPQEKLCWALNPYRDLPLRNTNGARVGSVRIAADWYGGL
ncbi:MAG: asparaginase [Rhodospirillales bacterium]|nr:asparaginase [Rhodospirillales bacterium]